MKQPPLGIQQWIYVLEEGAGRLWVRRGLLLMVAICLAGLFHLNRARNFVSPEAMDMAQLGRNIAEGRGYTTWNIRPLSVALQSAALTNAGKSPFEILKKPHADISNPPLYPMVLAGVLKVLPESTRHAMTGKSRTRPTPEIAIGLFNLVGLAAVVFMVYRITNGLFSRGAAIVAGLIFLTNDLYWDFVFSGLPTLWLGALVSVLAWMVAEIPKRYGHGSNPTRFESLSNGAMVGGLLGLACLTVYSSGWLLVPVVASLALSCRKQRWALTLSCVAAFLVLVMPWAVRNIAKSRLPFGTATVAAYAGTKAFPEDRLERSLAPQLKNVEIYDLLDKFRNNEEELLRNLLPTTGGSWFAAFFLVGLFIPARNPTVARFKWLVFSMFLTFLIVQPLVQTNVATLCPVINTENLIVLLAPLVIILAAGVMDDIWSKFDFPFYGANFIAKAFLVAFCAFPGMQAATRNRRTVLASPPYIPVVINQLCGYLPNDALMMSDMPWGVAWYGRRTAVGITLRVRDRYNEDFFVINDYHRSVRAIYLSPLTADMKWQSAFISSPDGVWARLYMDFFLRGGVPEGFPLKFAFGGGEGANKMAYPSAGHLLMADSQYW
ncbi:MAG TPA: hypothetical protein VMF06_20960 [Candidatus Limnocylindria bacterium]|jgi:hypothetical protein|nr:hypothetical protein [Candidatus Limnocylindria bacterium]